VTRRARVHPLRCECGYTTGLQVARGSRGFHLFECPECRGRSALFVLPTGHLVHAEPLTREQLEQMEEFTPGTVSRAFGGRSLEEVAAFFKDQTRRAPL
jgi:hypothetical protein